MLYRELFDCRDLFNSAGHTLKERIPAYVLTVKPDIPPWVTALGLGLTLLSGYVIYKDLKKIQENFPEEQLEPYHRKKPI